MKMSRKLTAAALSAALMALSGGALATHSWNNYHWARTSSPFTLQVVDSVTSSWQANMTNSLSQWAPSGVINFTISSVSEGSTTRKRCPMVAGQMRVCNASYGQNGWLGLASINLDSGGHISQGTAKMNDSYSAYWTPEEKNHVMCQEIGHVLGLGHTSEDGSTQNTCMDYSTSSTSQWPNNHDYQMLQDIYAHLDSYNSYAVAAAFGPSSEACADGAKSCDGKGTKLGTKVHKGKGYETWVYVEKDGSLSVHHVYTLPEA